MFIHSYSYPGLSTRGTAQAHKGAQRPCGVIYRSLGRRHLHMMTHPLHPGGLCICSGLSQCMALCLGFSGGTASLLACQRTSCSPTTKVSKFKSPRRKKLRLFELGVQKSQFYYARGHFWTYVRPRADLLLLRDLQLVGRA